MDNANLRRRLERMKENLEDWREKQKREDAQRLELSLRRVLTKQGLSEGEIEAKLHEQMARYERFKERFSPKANGDQDE
jgi:exonuclease VII large subunit